MLLSSLRADDDAASPVVGIILLVAITVILAAVITTIVLGIGEDIEDPAPSASILFESTGNPSENATDSWGEEAAAVGSSEDLKRLEITHAGGDDIDPKRIRITGMESDGALATIEPDDQPWSDGTFSTSDTIVVWVEENQLIEVIWESEGSSFRVSSFET